MNAHSHERMCGSWRVHMLFQAHAIFHVSRLPFTHVPIVVVVVMALDKYTAREGRLHQQTLSTQGRPNTCHNLKLIIALPPLSLLLPLLAICLCWSSKQFRAEPRVLSARAGNARSARNVPNVKQAMSDNMKEEQGGHEDYDQYQTTPNGWHCLLFFFESVC